MPKKALTDHEWRVRFRSYANGTFTFSRGQKPQRGSQWAKELEKIESCPKHGAVSSVNVFGIPIVCRCGYHDKHIGVNNSPPSSVSTVGTSPCHGGTSTSTSTCVANSPTFSGVPNSPPLTGVPNSPSLTGVSNTPSLTGVSNTPSLTGVTNSPSHTGISPCSVVLVKLGSTATSEEGSRSSTRVVHVRTISDHETMELQRHGLSPPKPKRLCMTSPQPEVPSRAAVTTTHSTIASLSTLAAPGQATSLSTLAAASKQKQDMSITLSPPTIPELTSPVKSKVHSSGNCLPELDDTASDLSPSMIIKPIPRQSTDFSLRLPQGWRKTVSESDRYWIGRSLFTAKKGKLTDKLTLWWYPPPYQLPTGKPSPEAYHQKRLFLWMPRRMWQVDFKCPHCATPQSLRSKGIYNHVRLVMDTKDFYYMAGECMECRSCNGTFVSWDSRMLSQLPDGVRAHFPVILTRKYACDRAVIGLLRNRTLGNSSTALRNNLQEVHCEEWLRKQLCYLTDCERYRKGLQGLHLPPTTYKELLPFPPFPTAKWFLAAYVREVWERLPQLLAASTSVYGTVLKIDSTKKICKKLQGAAAGTASWATNVGNERGEVVISVLTESEDNVALKRMANGLMERYEKAGQDPPRLLYTDRDCCCVSGPSKYQVLFDRWSGLEVRLDIWHFMRRLARGCISESHPLYGTFMSQLSQCIFEWDETDLNLLIEAKKGELVQAGLADPSPSAVRNSVTKEELSRHCKRKTRGHQETLKEIEALLLALFPLTDTLGVPLFKEEMKIIWEEQQQHVSCLQDPPGVPLYTVTGHITKGGVKLPTLRCARGSTSLESFHLHLARFIPGSSTSAVNYQAYLLDGITRWNSLRAAAAFDSPSQTIRTFDSRLQDRINSLSQSVLGRKVMSRHFHVSKYTGELFGAEYLYSQSGYTLSPKEDELDKEIDEGFGDMSEEDTASPTLMASESDVTIASLEEPDSEGDEDQEEKAEEDGVAVDSRGIPGWEKVDRLAQALVDLKGLCITNQQARVIKELYQDLLEYDKRPLVFRPSEKVTPARGRFGRSKRGGHISVDNMKRSFLSAGVPASSPAKSRLVEAICILLCEEFPVARKSRAAGEKAYTSRWRLVVSAYNAIRIRVMNSETVLKGTKLALFNINETTLARWYKCAIRRDEVKLLMQGLSLPARNLCSASTLPAAQHRPTSPQPPPKQPHVFEEAVDTVGRARVRGMPPPTLMVSPAKPTYSSNDTTTLPGVIIPTVSRTTQWRQRRKASTSSNTPAASTAATVAVTTAAATMTTATTSARDPGRKEYCCRICDKPMSSPDHSQYRGQRYCPSLYPEVTKEEWLTQRRTEAKSKAEANKTPNSD